MEELKSKLKVDELRNLCGLLGLPVSGVKDVLVQRIFDYFREIGMLVPDKSVSIDSQPVKSSRVTIFHTIKSRFISSRSNSMVSSTQSVADSLGSSIIGFNSLMQHFYSLIQKIPTLFGVIGGTFALYYLYMELFGTERLEVTITNRSWLW